MNHLNNNNNLRLGTQEGIEKKRIIIIIHSNFQY